MIRALREYDIGGIRTNLGFFRQILEDDEFRRGNLHTGFIDEFFTRNKAPQAGPGLPDPSSLAFSRYFWASALSPWVRSNWPSR